MTHSMEVRQLKSLTITCSYGPRNRVITGALANVIKIEVTRATSEQTF